MKKATDNEETRFIEDMQQGLEYQDHGNSYGIKGQELVDKSLRIIIKEGWYANRVDRVLKRIPALVKDIRRRKGIWTKYRGIIRDVHATNAFLKGLSFNESYLVSTDGRRTVGKALAIYIRHERKELHKARLVNEVPADVITEAHREVLKEIDPRFGKL